MPAPAPSKKQAISAQEAAAIAKAKYGGEVLSTRLESKGKKKSVYIVKLQHEGQVLLVQVDAQTGQVR